MVPDIFFGGQRGGGKTDGLIGDWTEHAGRYKGAASGIIFRRSFPELEEVQKRAKQILIPLGWKYREDNHTFTGPYEPGEFVAPQLKLRYLERNKDAERYQGMQFTWMGFDEAGNFPSPEPLDLLWACLRSAAGVPCVRRLSGNPGGPGHTWLKQRYIDTAQPFEIHRWQPQPELAPDVWIESVFIPARLEDNRILMQHDPGYEARLAAAGGKLLYRAWRFGDWDSIAGAMFDQWNRNVHVVAYEKLPKWKTACGMDWGYRAPAWIGLALLGPNKAVYWRKEWTFNKINPFRAGHHFGELLKSWCSRLDCEWPQYIACDSAMFAVTDGGKSIGQRFQEGLDKSLGRHTIALYAAPKGSGSRHARCALYHELLAWGPPAKDGTVAPERKPAMRFHPDCKYLIRTIPALSVAENDLEDIDSEGPDHGYDGSGYLLITHYASTKAAKPGDSAEGPHPGLAVRHKTVKLRKKTKDSSIDPTLEETRTRAGWEGTPETDAPQRRRGWSRQR